MAKDANYLQRTGFNLLLSSLDSKPFLKLPAQRFIWGYDDNFFSLAKGVMSLVKEMPYDKFGILAHVSNQDPIPNYKL